MGKDLKGKELGNGICQLKNKKYAARYTNNEGKRVKREFSKLQECKRWLLEMQYQKEHGNILKTSPTMDAWFQYWFTDVKGDNIRYHTKLNYTHQYEQNIKPVIGDMLIKDIKPMHCQSILNNMTDKYSDSCINTCRLVMYMLFDAALENELIIKNPVTKNVKCASKKKKKEVRVLTLEEQRRFLLAAKDSNCYNQFALILQTGLRVGELTGLRWEDVDFENSVLHVRRTMYFRNHEGWETNKPKTKSGTRDIPLTKEAIMILQNQREKRKRLPVVSLAYSDMVFLSRKGTPITNSLYYIHIKNCCEKAGMEPFSMHTLRHTFATRCIESGMNPKTLQMILGHSGINITMNLYVHVTDEEKTKEMVSVENGLKVV